MSKQYIPLANDIVTLVGGNQNIASLHHCQTRLRFQLHDDNKADQQAIERLEGVAKVLLNGGMFQIVIGMQVAEVYEEVVKLIDLKDQPLPKETRKKPLDIVTDFVSSIFSPIVPALAGAGMVKALLALLVAFQWIDTKSQNYVVLNMIGDATFAFMPILLAYTTAKKLKCSPILAAVVAGVMCHATWGSLVTAGESIQLFGIVPLYLVKYTGSVIPVVLVILVQAPLEKWLNRIIPNAVRLVFVPMILFLVMGVLGLSVLGPLGDYIGKGFTEVFSWLSINVGWLEAALMGGLYPLLVILGLHHGLAPLGTMQMAQMGYDAIFGPGVLCANIGQGTSALVTGLLSKDANTRQIGTSAGITGLMGITEPALYGINVPKKYPLIAGLIGSACGGLFAGLTHTHRYATGSSGLPAVMMYIGDNTLQFFYQILIALAITIVISAICTVIFAKRYEKKAANAVKAAAKELIVSPLSGTVLPLNEVKDEAFSSGALGKGIAIDPLDGTLKAPCDGVIVSLFPTKHAIGIRSKQGAEILIHIGLNTVELQGEHFYPQVKQGDPVKKGQILLTFDLDQLKAKNYQMVVPVVITNSNAYREILPMGTGLIQAMDDLLILE